MKFSSFLKFSLIARLIFANDPVQVAFEIQETLHSNNLDNGRSSNFSDLILGYQNNTPEILGIDTVKQYTGYIDISEKHFFYWFFESRNDPAIDPVILWLSGGPGCSSATSLFLKLGPASINSSLKLEHNPYSWNSNASVIFLDQPLGVGYSYTEGEAVKSTRKAAEDVYIFLEAFYKEFPRFLANKFHIASESYGGHYVPAIATEILKQTSKSFEISSILIGNGFVDPLIQYGSYKPMACGEGDVPALLDKEVCDQLERDYPKCVELELQCYEQQTDSACIAAGDFCQPNLEKPYLDAGFDRFDVRKKSRKEHEEMDRIVQYLQSDYVKSAVGSRVDDFSFCREQTFEDFGETGDESRGFASDIAEILQKDIPVLLYAGDKDYTCNWLGILAFAEALEYKHSEQFNNASLEPWYNKDGDFAGEVKNYDRFTFLKLFNASHLAVHDQPKSSLDMLNKWLQGDYALQYN